MVSNLLRKGFFLILIFTNHSCLVTTTTVSTYHRVSTSTPTTVWDHHTFITMCYRRGVCHHGVVKVQCFLRFIYYEGKVALFTFYVIKWKRKKSQDSYMSCKQWPTKQVNTFEKRYRYVVQLSTQYRNEPFPASPRDINLDESLLVQCSLTPVTQDLPLRSFPIPLLPSDADDHDHCGLSTRRRSCRITECVKRIRQACWETNHVQLISISLVRSRTIRVIQVEEFDEKYMCVSLFWIIQRNFPSCL